MKRLLCLALVLAVPAATAFGDEVTRGPIRPLVASTNLLSVRPAVARAALGQTFIAWTESTLFANTIRYTVLDGNGNPIVSTTALPVGPVSPERIAVAASSVGFIVVYSGTGGSDGFGTGIYYDVFDHNGVPITAGPQRLNILTDRDERWPAATGLLNGGFAVTWTRELPLSSGSSEGVFLRRVNVFGAPFDPIEVRVDDAASSRGYQRFTGVTSWPSGQLAVVWQDGAPSASQGSPLSGDGWGTAVRGRWLNAGLGFSSNDQILSTITDRDQLEPRIAAGQRNRCVVAFTHETTNFRTDVKVRAFDILGNPLGSESTPTQSASQSRLLTGLCAATNDEYAIASMDFAAITSGTASHPVSIARFTANDVLIEQLGIAPTQGSHGYASLGCDQYGGLDVVWQTLFPAAGGGVLVGASQQRLDRTMITLSTATASLGTTVDIGLDSPSDAGRNYQLVVSGAPGLVLVDTRWVKVALDAFFLASVFVTNNGVLNDFQGTLDQTGKSAAPSFAIPQIASLSQNQLHFSFVTFDPQAPSGVNTISDEIVLTIL